MSTLSVMITPPNNFIMDGKHVTFKAPCDSNGVTGVFINDDPQVYSLVDSRGKLMAEVTDTMLFKEGAMVHIVLDVSNHLAYVQNTNFEAMAAVESFNGRHGVVTPEDGDYTYDMVGAAAEIHAEEHWIGGKDWLDPEKIGAATSDHNHDGVYAKIDHTHQMDFAAIDHNHDDRYALIDHTHDGRYASKMQTKNLSGNINTLLEDNTEYICTNVTSLKFTDDKKFACGRIYFTPESNAFTTPLATNFSTFFGQTGDAITDAGSAELWEFNTYNGCIIWKNWGRYTGIIQDEEIEEMSSILYIYEPGYKKWQNVLGISGIHGGATVRFTASTAIIQNCDTGGLRPYQSTHLKVDFTHYNKLYITCLTTGTDSLGHLVGYSGCSDDGERFIQEKQVPLSLTEPSELEFDISGCNGEYYIKLQPSADRRFSFVITEIRLEK
jgi:hypothetical protein